MTARSSRRRVAVRCEPVRSATFVPLTSPPSIPAGKGAQHRGDGPVVLNGENLGRSEQCRLPAGIDDTEHCAKGDNRLAAPHIPLHEPVHRVAGSEVESTLLADRDLASGQRKWQIPIESALQLCGVL